MLSASLQCDLPGKDITPVIKIENTPINRTTGPLVSFAPLVKKAAPSVVNIYSSRIIRDQPQRNPLVAVGMIPKMTILAPGKRKVLARA